MPFSLKTKILAFFSSALAILFAMFKYQKKKADTLERAVQHLEEEISFQEGVSTAKDEVLVERHSRRSELIKELEIAKKKNVVNDLAYPDGKLDPDLIRVLNQGRKRESRS